MSAAESTSIYHFLPITLALLLLYGLSFALSAKKIISCALHRRIWNVALLISFLICALTGILLVFSVEYGLVLPVSPSALFWHVETGLAMAVISIFHIAWHWRYYLALFQRHPAQLDNCATIKRTKK